MSARRDLVMAAGAAALAGALPLRAVAAPRLAPFAPSCAWNVPVAGLPLHADDAALAARLWRASDRPGDFNLAFDGYTYPVYDASHATGSYPCRLTKGAQGNLDGRTVPWNPAWRGSAGSDRQAIVLDPGTGREWDFWRVSFDGSTVHAANGSVIGCDYLSGVPGPCASRGCGIPYLAMLVRPAEVAAGVIEHALSMPIGPRAIAKGAAGTGLFVPPATKSDGDLFGVVGGIPEGTRFALRVTDAEIETWTRTLPASVRQAAMVIARALRGYGVFVTDNSGGATLQFEDRLTAGAQWGALGLGPLQKNGKELPRDLLDGLFQPSRIVAVAHPPYPVRRAP